MKWPPRSRAALLAAEVASLRAEVDRAQARLAEYDTAWAAIRAPRPAGTTGRLPDGGATLSPSDLAEALGALDRAETTLRGKAAEPCDLCAYGGPGPCADQSELLEQAETYAELAAELGRGVPGAAGDEPDAGVACKSWDEPGDPVPLSELAAELESELAAEAEAAWDELGVARPHADLIAELGTDAAPLPAGVVTIAPGAVVTIRLPGLTGIRVDTAARLIAVDGLSGSARGERLQPGYALRDLRGGTYGGFHRLLPAGDCFDADCAASGEHDPDRRGPGES